MEDLEESRADMDPKSVADEYAEKKQDVDKVTEKEQDVDQVAEKEQDVDKVAPIQIIIGLPINVIRPDMVHSVPRSVLMRR